MNSKINLQSTITCPDCAQTSEEMMAEESCQYFWECPSCKQLLKPKKGDCCVFCSYGDKPCPPVQKGQACC